MFTTEADGNHITHRIRRRWQLETVFTASSTSPFTSVLPQSFSVNPPHTYDANIIGDIVGPSADNTVDSHNTPTNTEHQELQSIRFVTKRMAANKRSWVADNYKK
ncbi:hypothetical protein Hdeb2414_s0004g00134321 [Helianthus debilis subsp. tardiflorus]